MEITLVYIISQIFTIIMYVFLGVSYYAKDRKKVLVMGFLSLIANVIAYILLNAYSGLMMCILAMIRDLIFIIDENKNGKRDKMMKIDYIVFIVFFVFAIISAIFTYEGILSMLSIVGTLIFTYSVCQKKTIIYKICGIPVGICWIIYNLYIHSIFGVILESLLLICSLTGYILESRNKKKME